MIIKTYATSISIGYQHIQRSHERIQPSFASNADHSLKHSAEARSLINSNVIYSLSNTINIIEYGTMQLISQAVVETSTAVSDTTSESARNGLNPKTVSP